MGKRTAKVKYDDRPTTHVPERDGDWATWNDARYARGAADNEARKIDSLVKRAEKKAKAAASGKVRKPLEGRALQIANEHRDDRDRLNRDTRAFLAANPKLPSEAHPILRLWVQKLPAAKNLRVGKDKERITHARSKLLGLREAYVVGDRDMLGFLRVDIDACFGRSAPGERYKRAEEGWDELEQRIEASPAPMPNVGVGGCVDAGDFRNAVVRPHAIFMLKDSVYCGPKAKVKFKAKFDAIARRVVAAFIPLGADPGGLSNGCKSKNPLSDKWSHRIFRAEPWTLDELEAALPVSVSQRQLERKYAAFLATQAPKVGVAPDHADPALVSQSNQAHRHVCRGAQAAVRQHRATGTFEGFKAYVLELAQEVCPDPEAAKRKCDYVALWTWKKFHGRVPGQRLEPVALKAARATATMTINYRRTSETMKAVMSACEALPAILGRRPLVSEIAHWAGVSENSVRRYRPSESIPSGQQNEVTCPQNNAPRQGVVKKDLDNSRDGKEMGEATSSPVESLPSEMSFPCPLEALAPAPVEPVPSASPVANAPTLSVIPVPTIPAAPVSRHILPPPFMRSRWTPAAAPPCQSGVVSMPEPLSASHPHHGG